jgi:hypothetical protein
MTYTLAMTADTATTAVSTTCKHTHACCFELLSRIYMELFSQNKLYKPVAIEASVVVRSLLRVQLCSCSADITSL